MHVTCHLFSSFGLQWTGSVPRRTAHSGLRVDDTISKKVIYIDLLRLLYIDPHLKDILGVVPSVKSRTEQLCTHLAHRTVTFPAPPMPWAAANRSPARSDNDRPDRVAITVFRCVFRCGRKRLAGVYCTCHSWVIDGDKWIFMYRLYT